MLQPFWLAGAVVKPTMDGAPVFIEMTAGEAQQYQDAGVLDTEPGEVPAHTNTDDQSGGQDAQTTGGSTDAA